MDAVKSRFPKTQKFIDSTLKEECEKENMNADQIIFLLLNLRKKLAWINIFVLHRFLRDLNKKKSFLRLSVN